MAALTGDFVKSIFTGSLAVAFWVVLGIFIFIVIAGLVWYFWFYRKQFDIIVKVFSQRYGEEREFFDKGAILYDKKENTRFLKLLKTKVELELPKYNLFRKTNWGDYIEIRRISERGFMFLLPPKIEKDFYISSEGKKYKFSQSRQTQIEGDITYILNRERKNKSIIDPESLLLKVLQYLPQIMSGVISLFVLYIIFRYAPEWLTAMAKFVAEIKSAQAPVIVGS